MIKSKAMLTGATLALGAALWIGCAEEEDDIVFPHVEVVDRTQSALNTGQLQWANGTYTNCKTRSGSWSARVGGVNPMDYNQLSVVKNDTACSLTLTDLVADKTYTTTTAIAQDTSYLANASPFGTGGPVDFFANAKLSAKTFAGAFSVTILFSGNPGDNTTSTTAGYLAVSSSATESQVPPPSYTLDFAGLGVQTDVNWVVESTSGNVGVVPNGQGGEEYVVSSNQSLGNTYADLDAAFVGGNKNAIPGATPITTSTLALVGDTLPKVRSVIIMHGVNGVRAYQVIRVTFNHSP